MKKVLTISSLAILSLLVGCPEPGTQPPSNSGHDQDQGADSSSNSQSSSNQGASSNPNRQSTSQDKSDSKEQSNKQQAGQGARKFNKGDKAHAKRVHEACLKTMTDCTFYKRFYESIPEEQMNQT